MNPNSIFKLLDIFGAPLPKGGLSLTVPLLAFFRGGIYRLSTTLPLHRLGVLRSGCRLCAILGT